MLKKQLSLFLLALCFISGCSGLPVASPTPAPTETPTRENIVTKEDNVTVLNKDGINIAFPNEYYAKLYFGHTSATKDSFEKTNVP